MKCIVGHSVPMDGYVTMVLSIAGLHSNYLVTLSISCLKKYKTLKSRLPSTGVYMCLHIHNHRHTGRHTSPPSVGELVMAAMEDKKQQLSNVHPPHIHAGTISKS